MTDRRVRIRYFAGLKRRVVDPPWPGGSFPIDWILTGAPKAFDQATQTVIPCTAPGLSKLTFGKGGTAYMRDPDAADADPDPDMFYGRIVADLPDVLHLRFWRVRMSNLPSIHDLANGKDHVLSVKPTEGLAEACDVVVFKASGVVGWLLNQSGPARNDCLTYLRVMTGVELKLVSLAREDALSMITGELVTAVDVEVAVGHFEALGVLAPTLGTAVREAGTDGVRTVRVSFSAERDERNDFWKHFMKPVQALQKLGKAQIERLEVNQAGSDSTAQHVVNILDQQIGIEAWVTLAAGRTVEDAPARKAVVDGFNQYNAQIQLAMGNLDAKAVNQKAPKPKKAAEMKKNG